MGCCDSVCLSNHILRWDHWKLHNSDTAITLNYVELDSHPSCLPHHITCTTTNIAPSDSATTDDGAPIYKTELRSSSSGWETSLNGEQLLCAVCQSTHKSYTQMGRHTCDNGHTSKYEGIVLADSTRSQAVCVAYSPDVDGGTSQEDVAHLRPVEVRCGMCPLSGG